MEIRPICIAFVRRPKSCGPLRNPVRPCQRLTGRSVDPDALHWWIVFANFKLAVIVLTGVKAYLDGGLDQAYLGPTWIIRTLMRTLRQARA